MPNGNHHRVVVTGLGTISCLGNSVDELWDGLLAGRSGIRRFTTFNADDAPIKIGGEILNFDRIERLGEKWARRAFHYSAYGLAASLEAIENAGLDIDAGDLDTAGVVIANAHGCHGSFWMYTDHELQKLKDTDKQHFRHFWEWVEEARPEEFDPEVFGPPFMLLGHELATTLVAERIGSIGPRCSISTACTSGARAIDRAWRMLRRNQCNIVLVGGAEFIMDPPSIGVLHGMRALTAHDADPIHASKPFDRNRSGFVAASGSAILCMETLEHAKKRGANILAEMVGSGGSGNAYSLFAPETEGVGPSSAMHKAINDAGITPEDIDCVYAHATATGVGDPAESLGIKMTFGDHCPNVPITATKSMIGHSIAAAGAFGAMTCVLSLHNGVIPPTINLEDPDDFTEGLNIVTGEPRECDVNYAMCNAFGFGGANASNLFKKYDGT